MAYFKFENQNIYYEEIGTGFPLILLHGNSVSSKMFSGIVDLYKKDNKVILIDFLGHGRSDRLEQFPVDFWYHQAMQVIELITCMSYGKVNLLGTSGGALAALNVALERPDLVNKVIADSFEGESILEAGVNKIFEDRKKTKSQEAVCGFWEYCHGKDWEKIVDNDTDVVIRHGKLVKRFFHKDVSQLTVPTMITASLEDDEFASIMDIEMVYKDLAEKIPNAKKYLFREGGHPAMITNAEEFSILTKRFFSNMTH